MKPEVAIARWTGGGSIADLRSSVGWKAREARARIGIGILGRSVVVQGSEPFDVVSRLEHLPGVEWLAVGSTVRSFGEIGGAAGNLARKYLQQKERFSVEAEGTGGVTGSDAAGAATSGILDKVKGSRVSLDAPKIRFRAAFDGFRGVVGVQVRDGPGGIPTGRVPADCLVSGGRHSSVVAWMAALSGYRLRLIHARSTDDSLLGVARLYSELSHRMDPRGLSVEYLEGGPLPSVLTKYTKGSGQTAFGGFWSGGSRLPGSLKGAVSSPLFLLPEEKFSAEFESLGIKEDIDITNWGTRGAGNYKVRRFGGVTADVSEVLDGLA